MPDERFMPPIAEKAWPTLPPIAPTPDAMLKAKFDCVAPQQKDRSHKIQKMKSAERRYLARRKEEVRRRIAADKRALKEIERNKRIKYHRQTVEERQMLADKVVARKKLAIERNRYYEEYHNAHRREPTESPTEGAKETGA